MTDTKHHESRIGLSEMLILNRHLKGEEIALLMRHIGINKSEAAELIGLDKKDLTRALNNKEFLAPIAELKLRTEVVNRLFSGDPSLKKNILTLHHNAFRDEAT